MNDDVEEVYIKAPPSESRWISFEVIVLVQKDGLQRILRNSFVIRFPVLLMKIALPWGAS